jgi:hypothetical protein
MTLGFLSFALFEADMAEEAPAKPVLPSPTWAARLALYEALLPLTR